MENTSFQNPLYHGSRRWTRERRRARKGVRILLKWMKRHELFVTVVSSVIGALLGLMARDLIKGI